MQTENTILLDVNLYERKMHSSFWDSPPNLERKFMVEIGPHFYHFDTDSALWPDLWSYLPTGKFNIILFSTDVYCTFCPAPDYMQNL